MGAIGANECLCSGAASSNRQTPAVRMSEPGAGASTSRPEGEGATSRPEGEGAEGEEDKENDAAAVTAVIWKELAELSAAQAKLKVCCHAQVG